MTFRLLELSRRKGEPIGLLRLSRGSLLALYTNIDRPLTIGAETYVPMNPSRSSIRDSHERQKGVLTITLPISAPVLSWWYPYPPSQTIGVTWLAKHRGDDEVVTEWTGRVIGPKRTDTQLILSCEQSKTNARIRGQVLRWQRGCPLALYSQGLGMCNVDKSAHAIDTTVDDISGNQVTAAAFGTAPLSLMGGFAAWTRPDGEPEFRSIMEHSGETITLQYGTDTLADGDAITVYPGCPHDWAGCGLFANQDNYGGAKYLSQKSPFDGNPL